MGGNKLDLASKKVVSFDEAKELADSLNIRLLEASAKNAHNVEEAFNTMAGEIKQRIATAPSRGGGISGATLGAGQPVQRSGRRFGSSAWSRPLTVPRARTRGDSKWKVYVMSRRDGNVPWMRFQGIGYS